MAEFNIKKTTLKVASWNVKGIYNLDKLVYILDTLSKYDIDIALLQETKVWDAFEDKYKQYTLFFPKHNQVEKKSFYGVAIAVKNNLRSVFKVKYVDIDIAHRIMHCCLHIGNDIIHFINVYAPVKNVTLKQKAKEHEVVETNEESETEYDNVSEETKIPTTAINLFYHHLQTIFISVPETDIVFLFGDFNAHVVPGSKDTNCLGSYFVNQKPNKNGNELIDFCDNNDLFIVNTYIERKETEKMTHCNTINGKWSEIDLLVAGLKGYALVRDLSSYIELSHTDHCILVSTLKINLENLVVETPGEKTLAVDFLKLFFFFSNDNLTSTQITLDLRSNLEGFKNCIEKLYGSESSDILFISNQNYNEIMKVIKKLKHEITLSPKDVLDIRSKIRNAKSRIQKCFQYNEIELKEIEDDELLHVLKESNDRPYTSRKICNLPSLLEIDWALNKLEPSKKYIFFKNYIHSLISVVWKNEHVPIELCCSSRFNSMKEKSSLKVVTLTYNVLLKVLELRLMEFLFQMNSKGIFCYHSFDEMTKSLKLLQHKFNETEQHLYMAFVDWSKTSNHININDLLDYLSKTNFSLPSLNLISFFFRIDRLNSDELKKQTLFLEKYLWTVFFSYHLSNSLQELDAIVLKSPAKYDLIKDICFKVDEKSKEVKVLLYMDKMVILSLCPGDLIKCLRDFDKRIRRYGFGLNAKEDIMNIPVDILVPESNKIEKEIFKSIALKSNVHDSFKFDGVLIASPRLLERYRGEETNAEEDQKIEEYFAVDIYPNKGYNIVLKQLDRSLITVTGYTTYVRLKYLNDVDANEFNREFKKIRLLFLGEMRRKYNLSDYDYLSFIFFAQLDYISSTKKNKCFLDMCELSLRSFDIDIKTWHEKAWNENEWLDLLQ